MFVVEVEQETDGRWIAEVLEKPGALAYGRSKGEAASRALELLDAFPGSDIPERIVQHGRALAMEDECSHEVAIRRVALAKLMEPVSGWNPEKLNPDTVAALAYFAGRIRAMLGRYQVTNNPHDLECALISVHEDMMITSGLKPIEYAGTELVNRLRKAP